jgi:tRNA dimethylallyltransferase
VAPWLAVVGPTASGKSALALALAEQAGDVELVSADAMQVYRGMDIGTAKPTPAELAAVPHHLVDVADPTDDFSLARVVDEGRAAMADIEARGRRALVVGGTGLYVRGLVDELEVPGRYPDVRAELDADPDTAALHHRLAGLDPLAASRMEPTNRRRVVRALEVTLGAGRPFSSFGPGLDAYPPIPTRLLGLRVPFDVLDARIAARVDAMVEAGLVEEVRGLVERGLSRTARQALGYKEVLEHLEDGVPLGAAVEAVVARTKRFARRQVRWFRRDPRVLWLDGTVSTSQLAHMAAD